LKALLNAWCNHGVASYVGFVDLVKAYDTANHKLLIDILHRYGAPPKFVTAIETIYRNNPCMLKIESKVTEIPQSVGVRQGDNMAPVLFLFLLTAFAETLKLVWKQMNIPILSVMTATDENLADGKICSHTLAMFRSKMLTTWYGARVRGTKTYIFNPSLSLVLSQFLHTVSSGHHKTIHYTQQTATNTATMVAEPLAPPATRI
jgi:hypothetical protein